MKKFLAFLLIAIIACKTVKEMEDEELIKGIIDIIKKISKEVLNSILQTLKTLGKKAAEKVCCSLVPDYCSFCGLIVEML